MSLPEPATHLRLFYALELPADVRARAFDHLKRLREHAPTVKVSWEHEEKLHLTLKFLGKTEPARVSALTDAAARAAATIAPFRLTLAGVGGFPSTHRPRILWLGITDTQGQLARLHERLEAECAPLGFAPDPRPFHAHVTLARIRTADAATRQLAHYHRQLGFAPLAFNVNELILMRSDLTAKGAQYTPLARFEFTP